MQKNLLRLFIVFSVIVGLTFLLVLLVGFQVKRHHDNGSPVPFPALHLKDLQGADVDLLKLHPGKTLLVNYWATWCPPCITEIPSLMAVRKERQSDNFDVVFISLDFPENERDLRGKMSRLGLKEIDTLYMTDPAQWAQLGGQGLPITVLVNAEGYVISRMEGGIDWTGPVGKEFLKGLQ